MCASNSFPHSLLSATNGEVVVDVSRILLEMPLEKPFSQNKQSKQNNKLSFLLYFLHSQGLDPDSLMFRDGRRRIDMVLAFEEEDYGVMTEAEARKRDHRKTFQVHV